ncbi:MAG: DUF1570 domain-containing protein [Phycisphaerales bacterium]|nr:MAG: DUF1570 domain-containing protein [Phycisphaerales bacterium]
MRYFSLSVALVALLVHWEPAAAWSGDSISARLCHASCSAPGQTPDKDHLQRILVRNGASNLLAEARQSAEADDFQNAVILYRRYLDLNPNDDKAVEELLGVATQHSLPRESKSLRLAQEALPRQFRTHETRRFIVLSDADPQWTRQQAERLERAHHQFHRFARRHGLEPLPLEHKLVCILFEHYDDYREFAMNHDEVADPWIAGYYAPADDRIVFYNIESNPDLLRARTKLSQLERDMNIIIGEADQAEQSGDTARAETLRHNASQYHDHMQSERERIESFAKQVMTATTVHEAVHQIAFHTRVQSPFVHYPLWISEGMATAFETDTPGQAFGPDHDYAPRRDTFEDLLGKQQLLPVAELVQLTDLNGAPSWYVRAVYHQSYALFTWMNRFRAEDLRTYLQRMREQPPGRQSRERHLKIFTECFGDPDRLERAWLRHEKRSLN